MLTSFRSLTVEVDPSAHMVEDLFAQFLVDDEYLSADPTAEVPFSTGLEETPEDSPLDTPDDHFGSAAIDAELSSPMPCFGAEYKTDSNVATDYESFGIDLAQLFSHTAPFPAEPITTHSASLPPLDQAPYVIDQTPALNTAPLPDLDTCPPTPSMAYEALSHASTSTASSSSRLTKPLPTGVRRNITVDKLVPLDAPTQPRHYVGESATSRKVVPAAFRKKRNITEVDIDPNDAEAIEEKRRKNTLAARKSRARKLETLQTLQDQINAVTAERDFWHQRAVVAEEMLRQHGLASPEL